jgi:hypothetical protein
MEGYVMEQSHTIDQLDQDERREGHQNERQTEVKASVRPSVSSLLPTSNEPESREQRLGAERNGAYHEKVTTRRIDPHVEEERRRQMFTLGLEVALAVFLMLARKVWGWAQEERTRARVDRALRRRLPAT